MNDCPHTPTCAERCFPCTGECDSYTVRNVCGFCQGRPVGNARTWVDGIPRPPAACPRCGETHFEEAA